MRGRHRAAALGFIFLIVACTDGTEREAVRQTTAAPAGAAVTVSPAPPTERDTGAARGAATAQSTEATDSQAGGDSREWTSCEHPEGIAVEYPEGWHVNSGETLPPCSAFDQESLDVPDAQEFIGSAVLLSVEPVDFETVVDPEAQTGEELERREDTVDGHDAVRIETEAQGDGLLEDGTRSTRWLIVLDREETIVMVSHEVDDDYERNRDVLDEMASRLELPSNG